MSAQLQSAIDDAKGALPADWLAKLIAVAQILGPVLLQIIDLLKSDPPKARAALKAAGHSDHDCDLCEATCAALCASLEATHASLHAHEKACESCKP